MPPIDSLTTVGSRSFNTRMINFFRLFQKIIFVTLHVRLYSMHVNQVRKHSEKNLILYLWNNSKEIPNKIKRYDFFTAFTHLISRYSKEIPQNLKYECFIAFTHLICKKVHASTSMKQETLLEIGDALVMEKGLFYISDQLLHCRHSYKSTLFYT